MNALTGRQLQHLCMHFQCNIFSTGESGSINMERTTLFIVVVGRQLLHVSASYNKYWRQTAGPSRYNEINRSNYRHCNLQNFFIRLAMSSITLLIEVATGNRFNRGTMTLLEAQMSVFSLIWKDTLLALADWMDTRSTMYPHCYGWCRQAGSKR